MRVWVKNGLKRCHRVTDISRNPNAADEAGFCRSFCDLSFQNWFQLRRCENIAMEERGELLHGTAALRVKTKSHFLLTLQGWKPCQNQMNQGNDSEFLSLPEDELKLSLRLRPRLECKERCQSPSWGCQQPTGPALTADSTTEIFHIYREWKSQQTAGTTDTCTPTIKCKEIHVYHILLNSLGMAGPWLSRISWLRMSKNTLLDKESLFRNLVCGNLFMIGYITALGSAGK